MSRVLHFKFNYIPVVSRLFLSHLSRPALSMRMPDTTLAHRQISTVMPPDPLEEELLPYYNAEHFYHVKTGKIFNDRYQTIAKLGFGGGSTVWLARDLNLNPDAEPGDLDSEPYKVLKFCTCDYLDNDAARHELEVYKHLSIANPSHNGIQYIQTMVDNFEVAGSNGTHICLVFEPMRETLSIFQSRLKKKRFPLELLKLYLVCLLNGLEYLHTECGIVHADLKLDNILVSFEDASVLKEFVQAQRENPMFQMERDGYSIYQSHNQFGPLRVRLGPFVPIIADFGHAHWIDKSQPQINPIQPDCYRAPEVILGTGWGSSADIWNLGVLLWNMLEGMNTNLFTNINSRDGKYMARNHLAQMIALFGPPPTELLVREHRMRSWNFAPAMENDENKLCNKAYEFYNGPFFDSEGGFLYPDLVPRELKLENTISSLDEEEKHAFLDFVAGSMLCWDPEKRMTAKELLRHPWLEGTVLPWQKEEAP
ncbi:Serine/threonine-protein kinase SRPK [Lachnellula suecica]|uniref:non-specific serine/threonine protein kinase n=1 Tax=Lachnellula suecica TaxID=602035 RepID=A0A8T9C4B5_9HELO|nr:Serine/threonine-protein kinase SRPK [Lachnellula suecica]